jgi:4-hydroxybenzoate polyprenyltransferase
MRLTTAFLKLIRWPNLLFIVLTQLLFYYCIYLPLYQTPQMQLLFWLIAASVFIAAAGYIINDYFDLNIDQINKPNKNVLNAIINRRWAIVWHLLLSLLGVFATANAVGFAKWYLIIANMVCVALLWLYSTTFKRQLLIGNIIISLLAAWTVLILFFAQVPFGEAFNSKNEITLKFFRLAFLYGGFAFIISLIREAIKDIEDREGDAQYGCKTLPIYAGTRTAKIYISVWIVVLTAALIILQLYILQFQWFFAVLYAIILIICPLIYLLQQLLKAQTITDFSRLSALTKLIMLTGILSMFFFRLYF